MVLLTNGPQGLTVLRLEARKSFVLGMFIQDSNGRPLDIADSTITIVIRKKVLSTTATDDDNLISQANSVATVVAAAAGYARFMLQASDLDFKSGEYIFAITLTTDGYSAVIVKGIVELEENTEFSSIDSAYTDAAPLQSLIAKLQDRSVLEIRTGPTLAPGTQSFTDDDKEKLNGIAPGAQVNVLADWEALQDSPAYILNKPLHLLVPIGGAAGSILVKKSKNPGDTMWVTQSDTPSEGLLPSEDLYPDTDLYPDEGTPAGRGGLDATGIAEDLVPTSDGHDSWNWEPAQGGVQSWNDLTGHIVVTADDLPDGTSKVQMTTQERDKLGNLRVVDITDFPDLGSASALNENEVLRPEGVKASDVTQGTFAAARIPRIGALNGNTAGTADPTGGQDGDEYFQYTV